MKQLFSIALIILFMLPSVGVHFDLSFCCGNLEEVGISHTIDLEVNECCETLKQEGCMTSNEIIVPPAQQDFVSTQVALTIPAVVTLPYLLAHIEHIEFDTKLNSRSILHHQPPVSHTPSFLQVFLC